MKPFIILLLACVASIVTVRAFDHAHSGLNGVLVKYVKPSGVNYAGLKGDISPLEAYLDGIAALPEADFKQFTREQQMALLINLYNAATLKLVAVHYPVKSIKDIAAASGGPWKHPVVRLFGKTRSLDHLENEILRPGYKEPRIHFAINCASISCPVLRNEAFQAPKLSAQMDEQARNFLRDTRRNRLDAKNKTLHLSPIFEWLKADFTGKSGSVEKFIAPFFTPGERATIEKGGLSIRNTGYDWSLNQQ